MNAPRPHPIDILWQPGTLLSVFAAGELLAIVLALAVESPQGQLLRFGLLSFAVQWVAIFTLSLLYALRHELKRLSVVSIVAFALLLLLSVVLASTYASWHLLGLLWQQTEAAWWFAGMRFYIAMVAMLLLGMLALRSEWQSRQMQLHAKQAELDALRARVDPHFLFNTLNTATALLHERPGQAENVLLDLSDLFRAALSGDETASLERELQLTRRYLEIESLRLGDRLQIEWRLPERLPSLQLPTLALQSLVENAIRHGIEPATQPARLVISLGNDAAMTTLRVENPLPPRAEATPSRTGHRVGLAASRARIEAMTAGEGSLWTGVEGGQFVAEIRLPAGLPAASFRDETQPTTS